MRGSDIAHLVPSCRCYQPLHEGVVDGALYKDARTAQTDLTLHARTHTHTHTYTVRRCTRENRKQTNRNKPGTCSRHASATPRRQSRYLVGERRTHRRADGIVQIGVGKDDIGVLATQFETQLLVERRGRLHTQRAQSNHKPDQSMKQPHTTQCTCMHEQNHMHSVNKPLK